MRRVSPGEPLRISAMDWNRIAELVDSEGLSQTRKPYQGSNSPCIVLGCNQTGATVEMGMTLVLEGLRITPAENEEDFLSGSVYNLAYSGSGILGVALQPIEAGEIGPVVISGHVPVLASVSDASHLYANPDGNGYLVSAEDGAVRLSYTNSLTGLGWCNAVLGAGAVVVPEEYNGPFKMGAVVYQPPAAPSPGAPPPFHPLPPYFENYYVNVGQGDCYNTHLYRASEIWWQWQAGLVPIPPIDTSVIRLYDVTYAQIEEWGETKESYLSYESTQRVATVILRTSATGPMLEALDFMTTIPVCVVAVIGYVNAVVGYIDDPANQMFRGAVKALKSEQLWKYGESLNGVFTVGNFGNLIYPTTTALYPTAPGLYVNIYDGPLGAWPISNTQIFVKGGTIKRRFQGQSSTAVITTLADTIIDATVSTPSGVSSGRISVFPYQKGVSIRVSYNTLGCALFALGDYSFNQTSQRITAWNTSRAGGNGSFRNNEQVKNGYEVVNFSGGGFYISTKGCVLEPYDATHICFYYLDNNVNHADIIDISGYTLNQTYCIYFCSDYNTTGYQAGTMIKPFYDNQIGGVATALSSWMQSTVSDEAIGINNYHAGQDPSSFKSSIRPWEIGWRTDGDVQFVGGTIDCGWTTLNIANEVLSIPSSSEYVWVEISYSSSTGGAGTLTGTLQHGSSVPSSTNTKQIMRVGEISVSSSRQRIYLDGNAFLNDNSLARYSTAIVVGRCL